MKKKQIALLLASAMAVSSLTGCGQGQEATTSNKESSSVATEATETTIEAVKNFNEEGYPIVNEEVTLKVLLGIRDADNMCDPDEMPSVQHLEELTGINLEWEVVKASDWSTKLNLMFASEEYPDVILSVWNDVDFEEYGVTQKVLMPLDDLIEEYLPTYTERIDMEEADPTISLVASDGQQYSVGYMNGGGDIIGNHFFVNQTWLDALNLELPTDIESLTDTLRAFKGQDLNGNGIADEIPFTTRLVNNASGGVPYFLSLFGVPYHDSNWLYIDNNKEVQLVPAQEGFRSCMEWLHVCYKEGLLDVELFSQDGATMNTKINGNQVGFASTYNPLSNWKKATAEMFSLYIPDETTLIQRGYDMARPAAYITVANEHPEATMRLLDAMLDSELQWRMYWGESENAAKDRGWNYNDAGMIETWVSPDAKAETVVNRLGVCTLFFAPPKTYGQSYVESASSLAKLGLVEEYLNKGIVQKYSYQLLNLVKLDASQNEQRALTETEVNNAVMEHMATFIKQGVTDDSWKAFQSVLDNMKADEYIKMYQDGINKLNIK